MVLDELETQASRLGLSVSREIDGATLVVERGNGTTALIFESDGQLIRRTVPCWVPGTNFPGTSEQANLDWGMAVLLQYASGALAERVGERHDGPMGIVLNNVSNVVVRSCTTTLADSGHRLNLPIRAATLSARDVGVRSYLIPPGHLHSPTSCAPRESASAFSGS